MATSTEKQIFYLRSKIDLEFIFNGLNEIYEI